MKDYRLYLLDPFSGHIDEARELQAADDESALAAARTLAREDLRAVELWHRHHKLGHWEGATAIPD